MITVDIKLEKSKKSRGVGSSLSTQQRAGVMGNGAKSKQMSFLPSENHPV